MASSPIKQLEAYTLQHPKEVLIVSVRQQGDGEVNEVMIFRGFSSSLTHSTAFDPDVSIIAEGDQIVSCDRLHSPYDLSNPQYLAKDLSWQQMQDLIA